VAPWGVNGNKHRHQTNKKAVSRRVKNSFSEFFHHFSQINIAKLTCQVKIESQFYPFELKMQDLF